MFRTTIALICLGLLIGGGRNKKPVRVMSPPIMYQKGRAGDSVVSVSLSASAASRYLAVRHKLVVNTPESEINKTWEAVIAFCGTIQCELISSNIVNQTRDSTPFGSVSLRAKPEDVDKLIGFVGRQGKNGR